MVGPAKNHPWMLTTLGCPGTPDPELRNPWVEGFCAWAYRDGQCQLRGSSGIYRLRNSSGEEFPGIQGWWASKGGSWPAQHGPSFLPGETQTMVRVNCQNGSWVGEERPSKRRINKKIWSAANGGLRDGGLSKSEDIWGKRPFSSVFWIFQVLFAPSGKGRKRQEKGEKGRFRPISGEGGQTPLKPPFVTPPFAAAQKITVRAFLFRNCLQWGRSNLVDPRSGRKLLY